MVSARRQIARQQNERPQRPGALLAVGRTDQHGAPHRTGGSMQDGVQIGAVQPDPQRFFRRPSGG
jgi:hypothetical protein